jgi:putative peptidoglycan lipid II flippase
MKQSMLKSAGILTLLTILAKAIGFIRQMLIASIYGAGVETDAFFLASELISNILYALTTAIAVAFFPIYVEKRTKYGREKSFQFASKITFMISALAILVTVIVFLFAPFLSKLTAPTYTEEQLGKLILYFRVLSVGILFSMLTNLLQSILNAEKIYGYSAFTGIISSITTIAFIILFQNKLGVLALVISVPVAYFIQYLTLHIRSRKFVKASLNMDFKDKDLHRLLILVFPILLSNATVEISEIVDRVLASSLKDGAVSALAYAGTLLQFVTAIVIGTLSTVFYTEIAESTASYNMERVKSLIRQGILIVCIILLPISLFTIIYGRDIVTIAYGRGSFNGDAISMTTVGIKVYAVSFLFLGINSLITKVFYSVGNMKTPMRNGILCVVINIVASILLVKIMGLSGIIMGTVVAIILTTIRLIIALKRDIGEIGIYSIIPSAKKITVALLATGLVLISLNVIMNAMSSLVRLLIATIFGFTAYITILILLRSNEMLVVISIIKNKLKK